MGGKGRHRVSWVGGERATSLFLRSGVHTTPEHEPGTWEATYEVGQGYGIWNKAILDGETSLNQNMEVGE